MAESSKRGLETAQVLAAYLAVPAILVYASGFFAVFLQFMKYFRLDFYTAWYAAAVTNRTVVAGLGSAILVVVLLGGVLLSGAVGQALLLRRDPEVVGTFRRWVTIGVRLVILPLVAFVLFVLYGRIFAAGRASCLAIVGRRYPSDESVEQAMRHQLNVWPDSVLTALIFVVGTVVGGWLMFRSHQKYRGQERLSVDQYRLGNIHRFFYRGITEGWILAGLAVAYLACIIASLWLTLYSPAFVPLMTHGPTQEYGGPEEPTHNRFLSHAEGQWYFLHRIGTGDEGEYEILALAGGEEKYIRISAIGAGKPRVAPLPWPEAAKTWYPKLCQPD
jgi:hypothetical protein